MELTDKELYTMGQAIDYAVLYSQIESHTAEFALLKLKVEGEIIRRKESAKQKSEHDKMGCPFHYCDSNPPCKIKCRHS